MYLLLLRRLWQLLVLSPWILMLVLIRLLVMAMLILDVLERDLLSFVPGPYYLPYPYDENDGCESPPYTKDDWDKIHGVTLGLRKKELYKDPKVCRTAIDRFPTPAEIHRL
ncbi:hypothetical protein Tco_0430527, partial [Tanacetum coccineum]